MRDDLKDNINPETQTISYDNSGIDKDIIRAVKEMGFETMTPIQQQAIPVLLSGRDVLGQAQTGTGKTAAFGIPVLQMCERGSQNIESIILCPTRELAIQVSEELRRFAKFMHGVKVLPIYGGQDMSKQIRSLKMGVNVVVGTPGRVMDHMRRHTIKLSNIKTVVLDEADEMLNMGFREDIETILQGIPGEHQTALFSATMPQAILDITNKYQKDAVHIQIAKKEITIPLVKQYYYEVRRQNKEDVVARLLDYYNPKRSLIFCNTKRMVDELTEKLSGRGYFVEGLHGDLSQAQRDKVMKSFRSGATEILIATDVAARGIDVDDVEAVFNYDVPQDIEYYVHRIGRTGRAGKKGRSFTLVVGKEIYKIRDIERACKTKIKLRTVPTVENVTEAKSDKILEQAINAINEKDLTESRKIIEKKINSEDITALDLAAAFLKLQMGEPSATASDEELMKKERAFEDRNHKKDGRNRKDFKDKKSDKGKKRNPYRMEASYLAYRVTGKKKKEHKDSQKGHNDKRR